MNEPAYEAVCVKNHRDPNAVRAARTCARFGSAWDGRCNNRRGICLGRGPILAVFLILAGCDVQELMPGVPLVITSDREPYECRVSDACPGAVGVGFGYFRVHEGGEITITVTGGSPESRPQLDVLGPLLLSGVVANSGPGPDSNVAVVRFDPLWVNADYHYKICDCSGEAHGPYQIVIVQEP